MMFTVGADEGIVGLVKNIQQSLVQRNSGTENGSNHRLFFEHRHRGNTQRSSYLAHCVWKMLADFIRKNFSQPLEIGSETQAVFLYFHIAELGNILVDDRVLVTEDIKHKLLFEPAKIERKQVSFHV